MNIDLSRVNLTEKDIESWLWENPAAIDEALAGYSFDGWLARQYRVPSGIIDLLGTAKWHSSGYRYPLVVEVKNVPVDSSALAQVCRYAADIEQVVNKLHAQEEIPLSPKAIRMVIGPDKGGDQTLFEANALGVHLHLFSVSLDVELHGRRIWTDGFDAKLEEQYDNLATDEVFSRIADAINVSYRSRNPLPEIPEELKAIIKR